MAIKPIALSFKNTSEDKELYEWIISHSNLSGFIKDTLRSAMHKDSEKSMHELNENESPGLINMDF